MKSFALKLDFRIWNLLNIRIIKPTFWFAIGKNRVFQKFIERQKFHGFSNKKITLTLLFAKKIEELWLFLLSSFWGPLQLYVNVKQAQILDSWP